MISGKFYKIYFIFSLLKCSNINYYKLERRRERGLFFILKIQSFPMEITSLNLHSGTNLKHRKPSKQRIIFMIDNFSDFIDGRSLITSSSLPLLIPPLVSII